MLTVTVSLFITTVTTSKPAHITIATFCAGTQVVQNNVDNNNKSCALRKHKPCAIPSTLYLERGWEKEVQYGTLSIMDDKRFLVNSLLKITLPVITLLQKNSDNGIYVGTGVGQVTFRYGISQVFSRPRKGRRGIPFHAPPHFQP